MAKKKKSSKKKSSGSSYTPAYVTPTYVTPTLVNAVMPTDPADYVSTAVAPESYTPGTYTSQYADQLQGALDKVVNWNYDPMQDANYQALAKIYGARGNIAAKNTLADAAALNGGYGTSYAVSAAQQARNQYNQELASLIPDLEASAFSKAQTTLGALRDADDTAYGRFRDSEGDRQWKYGQDYNAYRDKVGDEQWLYGQNYQKYQDALSQYQWAMGFNSGQQQWAADYNNAQQQWALDYNNSLYAQKQAQKKSSGGGRGGRRSSGGGGGGGYTGGGGYNDIYDKAADIASSKTPYGPSQSIATMINTGKATASKVLKKATKTK